MNESQLKQAWQHFNTLLKADAPSAGMQRVFPSPAGKSFLTALQSKEVAADQEQWEAGCALHASISSLLKQLSAFENMSRCPILAVTGLLNAGKSSLLATYLSPSNQVRVLRGLGNETGTHRFVIWLPKIWQDDEQLSETLSRYLMSVFGHAPEYLADDLKSASLQYNGHILASYRPMHDDASHNMDPLSVPLLGYDERLNQLKLGLVDCPDIQTGFLPGGSDAVPLIGGQATSAGLASMPSNEVSSSGQAPGGKASRDQLGTDYPEFSRTSFTEHRRNQLSKVGRLCSAFIVVSKLNTLHDEGLLQILETLRDAMPGVPRFLAVNRVKARYSPQVVFDQARNLVDRFDLGRIYVAYDYRSALAGSRIPAPPDGWVAGALGEQQPIFFEVAASDLETQGEARTSASAESLSQPPSRSSTGGEETDAQRPPSQPTSYLFDLADRLDVGALSRQSMLSLTRQLLSKAADLIAWLSANRKRAEAKLRAGWNSVAEACYEFMAERDTSGRAVGLRLQASPAIVSQMADSLHRTAPRWMRLSLRIDRTMRQFHRAVSDAAARVKLLQSASESVTQLAKRFRRGEGGQVVTPQRLADALRAADRHDSLSQLTDQQLVQRCELAMQRFAQEDQTMLNEEQLDAWSQQVWSGMSLKSKLWKGTQPLAVMTAPLLAAILVPFDAGGSAVLLFASAKELLAAAGIAAVVTPMATGGEALQIIQQEAPWRQLSDLFAILCDSLGLPRPDGHQLPTSPGNHAPRHLLPSDLDQLVPSQPAISLWQANSEKLEELQLLVRHTARTK